MSKYTRGSYRQVRERRWTVHPLWRGFGCFFIILIPIMACAGGRLFQQKNALSGWFAVPVELQGSLNPTVSIVQGLYAISDRAPETQKFVTAIANALPQTGDIGYLELAMAALFLLVGFGLLTVAYSAMYATVGPSRYRPIDAPPVRTSPHRRPR